MATESPLDATHSPERTGPVWRDRGTIIANQQARIAELEADAAGLRARMLRLADEWADEDAGDLPTGDRAAELRAALAAEPTPAAAFCVCDHDQHHHLHGSGPCSRDVHETGALCDCRRFAESALSREVNRPTPAAEPHAEDGACPACGKAGCDYHCAPVADPDDTKDGQR